MEEVSFIKNTNNILQAADSSKTYDEDKIIPLFIFIESNLKLIRIANPGKSIREIQNVILDIWNNMTQEEKDVYI